MNVELFLCLVLDLDGVVGGVLLLPLLDDVRLLLWLLPFWSELLVASVKFEWLGTSKNQNLIYFILVTKHQFFSIMSEVELINLLECIDSIIAYYVK